MVSKERKFEKEYRRSNHSSSYNSPASKNVTSSKNPSFSEVYMKKLNEKRNRR